MINVLAIVHTRAKQARLRIHSYHGVKQVLSINSSLCTCGGCKMKMVRGINYYCLTPGVCS
jgi:hypothetical protein